MRKNRVMKLCAVVVVMAILVSMLAACSSNLEAEVSEAPAAPTTVKENVEEQHEVVDEGNVDEPIAEDLKIAFYWPAPNPFIDDVKVGIDAFSEKYGVETTVLIGAEWSQDEETAKVEALAAQGYKYIAVFPVDSSGAKGLYEELTANGVTVISYASTPGDDAAHAAFVGLDFYKEGKTVCEAAINLLPDKKGKILNVLELVEDINTVARKEGVEAAIAEAEGVELVQEISDIHDTTEAVQKIQDALAANINEVDAMIATGYTTTIGIATVLQDYYGSGGERKIVGGGIDTGIEVLNGIKEGTMDYTFAQNPYGIGYITCMIFKNISEGWTMKEDKKFVDVGLAYIDALSVDDYIAVEDKVTQDIIATLKTEYMEQK